MTLRPPGLRPSLLGFQAVAAFSAGCVSTPYRFAAHGETDLTLALREGEPQIVRDRPDGLQWDAHGEPPIAGHEDAFPGGVAGLQRSPCEPARSPSLELLAPESP